MITAIITGAGGFIGSHYVRYLKKQGYKVIGIDIKYPLFSTTDADEFYITDLRVNGNAEKLIANADELYMLAADMGGVGYIDTIRAQIMHNNVLINAFSLDAARKNRIRKVFFSSSACVYPKMMQQQDGNNLLKESDVFPAEPDTMYGWEKLFTEQLCQSYSIDYNMHIRVGRFHNIYGPEGVYRGGREKSPAALCRKVAEAKDGGSIEIWGDGKQSRSYCYIDDCCTGIFKLMHSHYDAPMNIGTSEIVTINQLVDILAEISGKSLRKLYDKTKPQGVRGRNSDNTLAKRELGWEPEIPLRKGLTTTYKWVVRQISKDNVVDHT